MSERSERLFEALSGIEEQKIDEAFPEERTNRFRWRKWGILAAALAVVIGAGSYVLPRLGGSAGAGGAGAGSDGASTFMAYAGPVFPLTLKEADSTVTAEREIILDFAPWVPTWIPRDEKLAQEGLAAGIPEEQLEEYGYLEGGYYKQSTDIRVTDAYTLTNATSEDKTVSVLYPFSGALYRLGKCLPTLTAGGAELNTTLHAGGYTGGFQGAWEGWPNQTDNPGTVNLDQVNSWDEYKVLLSDGRYQKAALGDYPDLSNVPVTVYRFYDSYGPEPDEKAGYPNPSIRAYFDLDYDKTTVLSYGFHAGRYDRENGKMIQGFSIRQSFQPGYGDPYYLVVIGDDIQNLTTGAYVTGGTDDDTKELDNAGVSVERYASDLEAILRETAELMYRRSERVQEGGAEFEMYFGLFKEFICSYGNLSESGVERYNTSQLEALDVENTDRVFYLEAEVDIPAGGSVTLAAEMTKEGSYDFACVHTENKGVYGYDMVTELGSNLTCTSQTAVLEDRGQIQIVRQNFGFDLANGVKKVTLDPEAEHYYLEVKRIPEK